MVRLEEMNSSEFQEYLRYAVETYAEEHVKAGNWTEEEALSNSTKEFERLLPDGEKTPNNTLYIVRSDDQEVGMVWLAKRSNNKGFIFDINIWDEHQGKGFGKKAIQEVEKVAKEMGLEGISLHVFGHNKVARNLYDSLGYKETSIIMEKEL